MVGDLNESFYSDKSSQRKAMPCYFIVFGFFPLSSVSEFQYSCASQEENSSQSPQQWMWPRHFRLKEFVYQKILQHWNNLAHYCNHTLKSRNTDTHHLFSSFAVLSRSLLHFFFFWIWAENEKNPTVWDCLGKGLKQGFEQSSFILVTNFHMDIFTLSSSMYI